MTTKENWRKDMCGGGMTQLRMLSRRKDTNRKSGKEVKSLFLTH